MKLAMILATLMLIGAASSEQAKVNGFNVSFELNKTHDTVVDTANGINGSATIRTFDGELALALYRYPKPLSVNATWINDNLIALQSQIGVPAEQVIIDKNPAILIVSMSKDTGKPIYNAIYYPDLKAGKTNTFVSITSTLPFYTTADLLRTIHVAI